MSATRPVEIELKYRLESVVAGERLLVAETIGPFTAASPIHTTQHEDRYLDTADGALARSGFAARLRTSAAGTVVTVKSLSNGGNGALNRREELEGPAERASQPRDWANSAARSLILELCGDAPLVETVTVRQLRRRRDLHGLGASVELSVDEVDVVARSRIIDRFVELEIELLGGGEEALGQLGAALAQEPGLAPQSSSKLESALRAARGEHGKGGPRDTGRPREARGVRESGGPDSSRTSVADVVADPKRTRDGVGRPEASALRPAPIEETAGGEATPASLAGPSGIAATQPTRAHEPTSTRRRLRPKSRGHGHDLVVEPIPDRGAERAAGDADGDTPARPGAEPAGAPETTAATPAKAGGSDAPATRLSVGKTPGVLGDDTLAEAGRKVLRFHFARMLNKEPGTRSGVDPEDLHGMRVATRRMRAAWRVFGDAFRPGRVKSYRRSMRDVAARLGAVRDLDVLLEAAEAYRADLPESEKRGLNPLLAEWRAHREDARILLLRELDSDGYLRFAEDFRDFVRTEGAGARPIQPMIPHRVRDTAASRIQSAFEQVRAYESVLRWADVETLHELRIAGKWLRYTMEFVRETLGPESDPLIARVVALQDHLGNLHDADVAASLARTFLVQRSGQLNATQTTAIGRYLVNREREVARLRRTVGPVWRGVAGLSFRRRLGRALATL